MPVKLLCDLTRADALCPAVNMPCFCAFTHQKRTAVGCTVYGVSSVFSSAFYVCAALYQSLIFSVKEHYFAQQNFLFYVIFETPPPKPKKTVDDGKNPYFARMIGTCCVSSSGPHCGALVEGGDARRVEVDSNTDK